MVEIFWFDSSVKVVFGMLDLLLNVKKLVMVIVVMMVVVMI